MHSGNSFCRQRLYSSCWKQVGKNVFRSNGCPEAISPSWVMISHFPPWSIHPDPRAALRANPSYKTKCYLARYVSFHWVICMAGGSQKHLKTKAFKNFVIFFFTVISSDSQAHPETDLEWVCPLNKNTVPNLVFGPLLSAFLSCGTLLHRGT